MNPITKRNLLKQKNAILQELGMRKAEFQNHYEPYAKQSEFHALGEYYPERFFMAGNQLGKTLSGCAEVYFHSTGIYPKDWCGNRFENKSIIWVAGKTYDVVADTTQKILFGNPTEIDGKGDYNGIIPLRLIKSYKKQGSSPAFRYVEVKHISGGTSFIYFKAYSQGRETFQGATVDLVWFDEEPPKDIYDEGKTRTNNGQIGQFTMATFTPLLGMTSLCLEVLKSASPQQTVLTMSIHEVGHYTKDQKLAIVAGYSPHNREAREKGIPTLGEGRIFQIHEDVIKEKHIAKIPDHWKQIGGIDFGYGKHPTALVHLLYDADNDVIHLRAIHKCVGSPVLVVAGVKEWGDLLFTYPHDGNMGDRSGSGEVIKSHYEKAGMRLTHKNAGYGDSRVNYVEPGILEMIERMETGRIKIDEHLTDFFFEYNIYHRKNGRVVRDVVKDGVIVKSNDDVLDAFRYGMMMIRYAETIKPLKSIGTGRIIL